VRSLDKEYHDGKQNDQIQTTGQVPNPSFGWHDAGDWDNEVWHSETVETLLLAYQAAPGKWRDGEDNIPESGNGVPDVLDEAMWVPIFTSSYSDPMAARVRALSPIGGRAMIKPTPPTP